ncbi:threonine ammonia-lyase [Dokdonia sinensis]|uniref:L-threonine dehydratase n=1 Tax=Dokdonia sinensis TaxID=2479847 RepID=A0A3M0FVZ3_9FLAO|nr:threonine ammonia-lyase [Dokdonia sinensis]RMB56940.1 threonine ammonia-lyase [Dokdonia sinensis]
MTIETKTYIPSLKSITDAANRVKEVAIKTPFMRSFTYSSKFDAEVFLKREDLQQVRSYKIRGAFNKMSTLSKAEKDKGIVCASAGNHAQGVALSCAKLQIHGSIYMPTTTPKQKVEQVEMFGGDWVTVILEGDLFDDAFAKASEVCNTEGKIFVHPFDDEKIIEGQATVGLEILTQSEKPLDYVFVPVGGGGLIAGLSSVFHHLSPKTQIIGIEPEGAPAMMHSLSQKENITLDEIDKFVDGAAVQRVGDRNFAIVEQLVSRIVTVNEGKICQTILDLYNRDAIVAEPAGAMTLAVLDQFADEIKGKNIACIVSGSNNDITRTAEIKERALLYQGLKHYFIIKFPQRAGALKEFVAEILGPTDDITYFEYSKKTSREQGPAIVGLEIKSPEDLQPLVDRMIARKFFGEYLNDKPELFQLLV